jgi:hypothetical protein
MKAQRLWGKWRADFPSHLSDRSDHRKSFARAIAGGTRAAWLFDEGYFPSHQVLTVEPK